MAPSVTVVMPTYDGAAFVGRALASVAAQADEALDVVVADDGSTDATLDVVRSFAGRLRLTVLERPHDGSWVRGTNLALREARGESVSFLHQDDAWRPGRLARVREAGADVVLHATGFVDAADQPLGRWTCPLPAGEVPRSLVMERLAVQNCVGPPSVAFRRVLATPLDESLWFTADWDLWRSLVARATRVVHVPEALAETRVHRAQQTAQRGREVDELRRQVSAAQARVLDDLGRPPSLVRAAAFNREVTASLAALAYGGPLRPAALLRAAAGMRPADWVAFARAARVAQRSLPRVRARWRSPG